MVNQGQLKYKFFRYFLLILFLGYFGEISLFFHAHENENSIVVHSHPFKKHNDSPSPFEKHNHTDNAYFLIDLLNTLSSDKHFHQIDIPVPYSNTAIFVIINKSSNYSTAKPGNKQLRAPPYLFS
jgi:hypothetical protein